VLTLCHHYAVCGKKMRVTECGNATAGGDDDGGGGIEGQLDLGDMAGSSLSLSRYLSPPPFPLSRALSLTHSRTYARARALSTPSRPVLLRRGGVQVPGPCQA
jgi:hypothetical protein